MAIQDKPKRKNTRLKNYDYSSDGCYFITICTKDKQKLFGQIIDEQMKLSVLGRMVNDLWLEIPGRYFNVRLDEFVVMPNHIHGIVVIDAPCRAGSSPAPTNDNNKNIVGSTLVADRRVTSTVGSALVADRRVTLGEIIGSFKSLCCFSWRQYLKNNNLGYLGKIWQCRYYDHVIRDEQGYWKIINYIYNNPTDWLKDENYIE